ncbi:UNVERIFIED_CONTAM: hypothetical protein Cloal_4173 [Acetivibrio alkalicellulosi]
MKKFGAFLVAGALTISMSVSSFANSAVSHVEEDGTVVRVVSTPLSSFLQKGDFSLQMTIGSATLTGENRLFFKPRAEASTSTLNGAIASIISAKTDVNNNGQSTNTTGWKNLYNTTQANSGWLSASTNTCTFNGFHSLTVNGNNGSTTTTLSY